MGGGGTGGAAGSATGGAAGSGGSSTGGAAGSGGSAGLSQSFGSVEVLADQQDWPVRVELAENRVYWSSPGNISVSGSVGYGRTMERSGGTPTTFHTGAVSAILPAGNQLLWANRDDQTIRAQALDGSGSATTLVSGAGKANDLTTDGTTLYWSGADTASGQPALSKAPLTGGTPTVMIPYSSAQSLLAFMTTGGGWMYVGDLGGGQILGLPSGGSGGPVATGLQDLGYLAANAEALYFATQQDGSVWKLAHGGSTPELVSAGLTQAYGVALDVDAVYATTTGDNPSCNNSTGTVVRIPLAGGAPQVLASGQTCPFGIAVDESGVYWVNAGLDGQANSGQLVRVPRL